MKKIGLLCLALVLALGALGVGFATWTDTLYIDGTVNTGTVSWEFYGNPAVDPVPPPSITQDDHGIDPGHTKDVGSTSATFTDSDNDGDLDTMNLLIDNAYPCYNNHVGFWLHCNGSVPLVIQKVIISDADETYELTATGIVDLDLNGNGTTDIKIAWGNGFGTQLHYCEWVNMSFGFHIVQDDDPAIQGQTLSFTIELVGVQYNEA